MTLVEPSSGGLIAAWCDSAAVESDARLSEVQLPDGISYVDVVQSVSEKLWRLSGSRWSGARTDTVRPHRLTEGCGCDMSIMIPAGTWSGIGGWFDRAFPEAWGCGCPSRSVYELPGGRVIRVDEIIVDGATLDPSKYVVYDNRQLVRLDDGGLSTSWPCCQRIATPDGELGTWSVRWTHGQVPPTSGSLAAYAYSIATAKRFNTKKNTLPERAQRISRQDVDITIESDNLLNEGRTGIPEVDEFVEAYNPHRLLRRAQVFDPDTIAPAVVTSTD